MAKLTNEQLSFLKEHKIEPNSLFDATDLKPKDYKALMEKAGKKFAYGVSPCAKSGHTLKTIAGHCIQCKTSYIGFQKRNNSNGFVYIAGSIQLQCVKVGVTSQLNGLEKDLLKNAYGGAKDWVILCCVESMEMGMIREKVRGLLQMYSVSKPYLHDGHMQDTNELFSCSYTKAFDALIEIKNHFAHNLGAVKEMKDKTGKYNFRNLRPS